MGWSCSQKAGRVLDKMSKACVNQTGMQNVFEANGSRFFFETNGVEYADGSIRADVFKFVDDNSAVNAGGFRIFGDGATTKLPAVLEDAVR